MENELIKQYPLFLQCANKAAFKALEQQACDLLGLPNAGAKDYCNPIIDVKGVYYFTVNPEVSSLVDLNLCITYESIILPAPELFAPSYP
jgi:hypothetical protein